MKKSWDTQFATKGMSRVKTIFISSGNAIQELLLKPRADLS